jgi:hypothetical protein
MDQNELKDGLNTETNNVAPLQIEPSVFVSYAPLVTQTTVELKPMSWVIEEIRSSLELKEKIDVVRAEKDPDKRNKLKAKLLPYFTFSQFTDNYRKNENFKHTRFILLDIDHVPERLESLRKSFKSDSNIFLFFVSPSGDGLKVVFTLSEYSVGDENYRNTYARCVNYLKEKYGVAPDTSTTDPARATFCSSDPDIYVNWSPVPFDVPAEKQSLTYNLSETNEENEVLLAMKGTGAGGRHLATTRLASFYKSKGMDYIATLKTMQGTNQLNTPPLSEAELEKTITNVFKRENYGNKKSDKVVYSNREELISELNKQYALVTMGGDTAIIDSSNPREPNFLKTKSFREVLAPQGTYEKTKNGTEWIPASKIWMESAARRQYDKVVFRPNEKPNPREFNMWFQGRTVEPVEGAFANIEKHMKEIICSGDEVTYNYLMLWMAHLLQKPEQKVGVAPLLLSPGKGTGKGIFIDKILMPLVGKEFYSYISNAEQITGRFNRTLERCMLCFLDEAFFAGDIRAQKMLDTYITSERISIERKGIDSIQVDSFTRFVLSTNDYHAIHSSFDERRYLVLKVSEAQKKNKKYFDALIDEHIPAELPGLLFHLLHLDISTFDRFNPPNTDALLEQAEYSQDSFSAWYSDWVENECMVVENGGVKTMIINLPAGFYTASAADVYKAYTQFCAATGYKNIQKPIGLGRRLVDKGVTAERIQKEGIRVKMYDFRAQMPRCPEGLNR